MQPEVERLYRSLTERVSMSTVLRREEPLARRTTLRVGGCADVYVEPAGEQELGEVVRLCRDAGVRFFVLGRGSNLLVRDGGIRGVVISLGHEAFSRILVEGVRLRCGAGVRLKQVAVEARRLDLGGLEFLEGIPGSLGGALRMNAGAMGCWTFDRVESVRFMDRDGRVEERDRSELEVRYRGCPWFREHIALGALLLGEPTTREEIERRVQEFNRRRWTTQPAAPSAGCIFKNPERIPAGKLIDELGLKGMRVGDAVISDVHANFIVNEGEATASEVLELIELVRGRARVERGVELETEVEIVGE